MAFFEKFGEKLTNAGKDVARKTKELADITKLNMQIGSEEDNIKNKYLEIGKLYYELFSSSPNERFAELCSSIAESTNKINTLKDQIQEIKGVKKCSKCGAEITNSSVFCSVCGNKTVSDEATATDKAAGDSEVSECNQNNTTAESTEVVESSEAFCDNEVAENSETSGNNETVENSEVPENADISQNVDTATMLCASCNKTVTADAAFCPDCGNKLK